MNQILKLILLGAVAVTLVSCSSDPKKDDSPVTEVSNEDTRTNIEQPAQVDTNPLEQGALARRIIYFDFNQADISNDDREFITAHASYLSQNSGSQIVLQGHADERGTREYNISLGELRGKAVEQLLLLQGASKSQIKVLSFGEERPAEDGHDESAWSQNRRVELVYN